MQALARLCDRAILLERASVVTDGPSEEVVARYLQSEAGSGSRRVWPDLETAPGESAPGCARCGSSTRAAICSTRSTFAQPVGIEIALHASCGTTSRSSRRSRWSTARVTPPSTPWTRRDVWEDAAEPGDYVSTAWIPGNFLNEGLYEVEVGRLHLGLTAPEARAPCGRADAVSFHVHDPGEGDSAQGPLHRHSGAAPCGRCSSGRPRGRADDADRRRRLVHNEDVYVERAIRNVAGFCDRDPRRRPHVLRRDLGDRVRAGARATITSMPFGSPTRLNRTSWSPATPARDTWVFGPDGDELYDPDGPPAPAVELEAGRYDRFFRLVPAMMHCVSLDSGELTASGYLSPPSRCGGKLFNFAAIESWTRVYRQCLHDGEIAFRPGWKWEDVHHFGENPGFDESHFRCLHACFLRRSSREPEDGPSASQPDRGEHVQA